MPTYHNRQRENPLAFAFFYTSYTYIYRHMIGFISALFNLVRFASLHLYIRSLFPLLSFSLCGVLALLYLLIRKKIYSIFLFLLKDVVSPVNSTMAAYRNAGIINSPNTNNTNTNNNNNNNNSPHQHHMSATLNRDGYDYPSTKYNQSQNYKSVTMPKNHYPTTNATTSSAGREYVPRDDGASYLATSSSYDNDSNLNEPTKRMQNPNAKFSIQKMIRQGFSSWRTRKKPSSASSSSSTPPPSTIAASNTTYTDSSTPPPSQPPPLSTGRYVTNNNSDDLTQIPPPTAVRSVSVDSISNNTTPKRIIVTEPVNFSPARASSVDSVTVDFDRPPTAAARAAYIPSPWTGSSTSNTTTNTTTATASPIPTEFMSQPAPVPTTRVLPVQFTGNSKIPVPRATPPPPPSSSSFISPPQRPPSVQNKPIETNNSTTPITNISTNSTRVPPPGKTFLFFGPKIHAFI